MTTSGSYVGPIVKRTIVQSKQQAEVSYLWHDADRFRVEHFAIISSIAILTSNCIKLTSTVW